MKIAAWLGIAACLVTAPIARAGDPEAAVRVHLPRTIQADGDALHLRDVAVVQCADAALGERCGAIGMGRAPWSGEELIIDRPILTARLATFGVRGPRVRFTGAERVVVTRAEAVTSAEAVRDAARALIEKTRPAPSGCTWQVARGSDPIRTPAGSQVDLVARMAPHAARGEARVTVAATADGQPAGTSDVVFRLTYPHRRLRAARDIAPGEVVAPENTTVEMVARDRPDPGDWSSVYGGTATRLIPVGAEVKPGLVELAGQKVVVRRNEGVVMTLQGALFRITAVGTAMENGRPGEVIHVRNADSGRVVLAKVAGDGTVEPVMAER